MPAFDATKRADKLRAQMVKQWFDAFATDREKTLLLDASHDRGAKRAIVSGLEELVVGRLVRAFKDAIPLTTAAHLAAKGVLKAPSVLLPKKDKADRRKWLPPDALKVGAIESRCIELNNATARHPFVTVDRDAFQQFREEWEPDPLLNGDVGGGVDGGGSGSDPGGAARARATTARGGRGGRAHGRSSGARGGHPPPLPTPAPPAQRQRVG